MLKRIKNNYRGLTKDRYMFLTVFGFFLVILTAYLVATKINKVQAGWWNDGWMYRKPVTITNAGSDQTDFQVSITLDTAALITAGKMQTDCDDLRITDINGKIIPHWVEENNPGCNNTATKVWTKVPSIPTSDAKVYAYYGNPSAISVENGEKVFEFFDDFENYSIGSQPSKWTRYWGAMGSVESGGTSNALKLTSDDIGDTFYRANTSVFSSFVMELRSKDTSNNHFWFGSNKEGTSDSVGSYIYNNHTTVYYRTGQQSYSSQESIDRSLTISSYHNYKLIFSNNNYKVYEDDIQRHNKTVAWTSGYAEIGAYRNNEVACHDNVRIRKYAATEPSAGSPGSEEQAPDPVAYWKFDEGYGTTAHSSTQTSNNATITNATWQDESMCVSGKCLNFNGSDSSVVSNNIVNLDEGMTVSGWINVKSQPHTYSSMVASSASGFVLYFTQDGDKAMDAKAQIYNGSAWTGINCTTNSNFNEWHFLSLTYNDSNTTAKVYLNGKKCSGDVNIPSGMNSSYTQAISMGKYLSSYWHDGYLDDVKIYPYARSAQEIKQDYTSRGSVHGASAQIGSQNPRESLSQGLFAYWKMDEASWNGTSNEVVDSSGNSHHGIGVGTTKPTTVLGKFGNAGTFNSDNYVSVTSSSDFEFLTEDFAYSVWIKQTSSQSSRKIINIGNPYCDGCNPGGYVLQTSSAVPRFTIDLTSQSGDIYNAYDNGVTINDGKWHHIVSQRKGDEIQIYVDGELIDTTTLPEGATFNSYVGTLTISGGGYAYDGEIDEVRGYNRALSSREVRTLYNWAPSSIAYYPFDEGTGGSTQDRSGNGSTGTWNGTGSHWTNGKFGKAGKFNGSNDYVNIPNNQTISPTNSITIEAWINPTNTSTLQYIINHGNTNGNKRWKFYLQSNILYLGVSADCSAHSYTVSNTFSNTNQWTHVAATYENGSPMKMYINGVLVNTGTTASTICNANVEPLTIGVRSTSTSPYTGLIDDVRIYNYARTSGQITEDMNAGHPIGGSPVGSQVGYWDFEEGYGSTATDSVNNKTVILNDNTTYTNDGKVGKALTFDGADDYASRADDNDLDLRTNSFTASAWVKQPTPTGSHKIIVQKGGSSASIPGYWFSVRSDGKVNLYISNGTSYIVSNLQSTSTVNNDAWNYIAFTWNPNVGAKIYIDGVLNNEYAVTTTVDINDSGVFKIGGYTSTGYTINGEIDEVKIYNTALTSEQVKIDMNQGATTVLGATSTNSSGNASWSSDRAYCPPGDNTANCAPVGEWKMDENTGTSSIYDTSDNNQTGTILGSMTESDWVPGKYGSALLFDGTDDSISVTDSVPLSPTSAVSVEAWIYMDASPGDPGKDDYFGVVQKDGGYSGYGNYGFRIISNNRVSFQLSHGSGVGEGTSLTYSSALQTNAWYHIVVTYDKDVPIRKIYINGRQVISSSSYSETLLDSSDVFRIASGDNRKFSGVIDQVAVYNYARTQEQIAWNYNRGKPVGHWELDACQGTTAYDNSGNSNNGTITAGDTSGSNDSVGTCSSGAGDEMWDNGTDGKRNASLDFDGTNDYVDIGSAITEDNITYAAWIKATALETGVIASQGYASYVSPPHGGIMLFSGKARMYSGYIDSAYRYAEGSANIADNTWHHIIGISNSNGTYVYVDGKLDGQDSYKVSDSTITPNLLGIGAQIRSTDQQFFYNGQIDDVRVYNYALTPLQIKTLFNNASAVHFK